MTSLKSKSIRWRLYNCHVPSCFRSCL